jgi:hypothetical protein
MKVPQVAVLAQVHPPGVPEPFFSQAQGSVNSYSVSISSADGHAVCSWQYIVCLLN